jgi:hypothetical protein
MCLIYENLRDLNFEYRAGKACPEQSRRCQTRTINSCASLEEEAAAIMAEIARLEQAAGQMV